jgi:tetratricopeptide (TPR) repeat protein
MVSTHPATRPLAVGLAVAMGLTISLIGRADAAPVESSGLKQATDETTAPPEASSPQETAAERYTRAMLIGYAAAEAGDFHTALINFRRALEARPGDHYALAAIANMEAYIAVERAEAAKRQRILDLGNTLSEAVAIRDWSCAVATVDELITLVPPNSLERAELVTYRGELSGFLEARDTVENWSTVCPGWLASEGE